MLKKKKINNSYFKISYDMLKKSNHIHQFNYKNHPKVVESTRFFDLAYFPGWVESTDFLNKLGNRER